MVPYDEQYMNLPFNEIWSSFHSTKPMIDASDSKSQQILHRYQPRCWPAGSGYYALMAYTSARTGAMVGCE